MVYLSVKDAAKYEGITDRAMRKRIQTGKVMSREIKSNKGRGGVTYEISLSSLSPEAQSRYWAQNQPDPQPQAHVFGDKFTDPEALQREMILEQQVQRAMACPQGIKSTDWVAAIAEELGMSPRSLYRKMENMKTYGTLKPPRKKRADRGVVRSWDGGAEDIFRTLAMKPENRHATVKALYNRTIIEAEKYGLHVGSERTAYRIYEEMGQVAHTFRKKGWRGVENEILPPILRDYSKDLQPNDIWVGDQHTWNWFVINEFTGTIFRLQGYVWQDLRTRGITGVSLAAQYDSPTIGLALRDGILPKKDRIIYGKPRCVYTDWGKPERSQYLTKFSACGIDVREIDDDFEAFVSPFTQNDTGVYDELSISTRKAIVRNSKAKLIERTFGVLEQMLADEGLKGYAGYRAGSMTDADKEDLKRWKASGELMTVSEFAEHVFRVVAKYNTRAHRGYGMRGLAPNDVFNAAVSKGFKPLTLDKHQADLIFMKSARRKVSSRGVNVDGNWFHDMDKMVHLVGSRVEIRWVPYGDEVLVFHNGDYVCNAPAYRYGSMVTGARPQSRDPIRQGDARSPGAPKKQTSKKGRGYVQTAGRTKQKRSI